jgi:tyrosine-protein kinase Etk/Wzc
MSELSSNLRTNRDNSEDEIDLTRILQVALDNWILFALCICASLIISYLYVWYAEPNYEMTTTVLVEDQDVDITQSILEEVGVGGSKTNIQNEIAILKSRSMMEKALGTLDLNVNYTIDLGLRKRVLYENTPLKIDYTLSKDVPSSFLFHVTIEDNDSNAYLYYEIFSPNGDVLQREQEIVLGEQFNNSLGSFRIIKTEKFASYAAGDSAISKDYNLRYRSIDHLATMYMDLLSVEEAREKASILRLKLKDNFGKRGVDILNAILNVYIQNNIEKKNQLAANSLKFIENQLQLIVADLSTLESQIKVFKTNHGVSDVSAEASFFLQQVGALDRLVSEIDVKLSIIDYLEQYITSGQDLNNASPSSLGIDDILLQRLIVQLNELNNERESMLRFTQKDNPLVDAVDAKISDTKTALINNIKSVRNGLNASKGELEEQLGKVETKVRTLPKAEYELLALQRQYSIKESLYLLLLEKKSENAILLASTVSDNMVIDTARSSEDPIAPKKKLIYFVGLLVGIGFPSLIVLIISFLDNRIKGVDHLRSSTRIPLLGIIPNHKTAEYIVVQHNNHSAIAESFRSIRTNLSFLVRKDELTEGISPKVIQLTSAMGSEGKSFCSINLAASLALGGSKTIVVGLDLRKPKLADYLSSSNDIGASSVLANISSLEEAIIKTEVNNLDVLVGGPIPPNPSELLMSGALKKMLDNLSEKYDYVILDTPPIGLVTDSLIISELVATTIYVVRQNITNTNSLTYISELYDSKKIKSVSILFNDVKASRFGYGYGYGYGYGNYAETAPKTVWERLGFSRFS